MSVISIHHIVSIYASSLNFYVCNPLIYQNDRWIVLCGCQVGSLIYFCLASHQNRNCTKKRPQSRRNWRNCKRINFIRETHKCLDGLLTIYVNTDELYWRIAEMHVNPYFCGKLWDHTIKVSKIVFIFYSISDLLLVLIFVNSGVIFFEVDFQIYGFLLNVTFR